MPTAVDQALEEIAAALLVMGPQHEGLRDFARLNLAESTLTEIRVSISQYDRRLALLLNAKAALFALVGDGHPALDIREIPASAYDDLRTNAATIEAALAQFGSAIAVSIGLEEGATENKA